LVKVYDRESSCFSVPESKSTLGHSTLRDTGMITPGMVRSIRSVKGTSTSGGTSGGGGGDDDEQCASVQDVLLPILRHLDSAHLERSPGEQVQDALALDSYLKMHTVWVETILAPVVEGG
jgi:hypothetical protein